MRKLTKIIGILALILLFFPLFFNIIENQNVAPVKLNFLPMKEYPLIGEYIPEFLFWVSLGFMILLLIGLLVIIFFPNASKELHFEKSDGALIVQAKALENFVLTTVQQEPYISEPNVKVKIKKKKIKIKVQGKMRNMFHATTKQEQLAAEIKDKITTLIGPNEKVFTEVTFKNFKTNKTQTQEQPRVI
ncbi:alkaline shock response membrane anchor protein AmaP [Enterococcus sp. AZ103]|uniref:alkaline shock response membrane anchor protein AmaP n=1 Tax=Enterococcus sp. AZ103 TaxID=2774628 RepID=UPI003F216EA0